jgi:hypothetical protein
MPALFWDGLSYLPRLYESKRGLLLGQLAATPDKAPYPVLLYRLIEILEKQLKSVNHSRRVGATGDENGLNPR